MAIINQTNRTVLMEEINPEKLDMLTLVGDVKGVDSLSDDKVKEINDNLLVSSFDKFLEKFDPTIYSYIMRTIKGYVHIEKPESIPDELLQEIHLNMHNDF